MLENGHMKLPKQQEKKNRDKKCTGLKEGIK